MRIGMFCDMYMPHVSGVTNHIRLYSQALTELGHDVSVFTYGNREEPSNGIPVYRSPAIAWGSTGWNVPLRLSAEARSAIERLDVAHAHHPFASCIVPLRHCRPRGVPVVFTNHTRYDLYSDVYTPWVPQSVRQRGIRSYLTRLNERVSLTISPSNEIATWLEGYGVRREKLLVFPNGIDVAPFARPARPWTRDELGLAKDDFVLAFVGRLAQEKNIALLIDAFIRAAAERPSLALVLLGDGPARAEAEQRIADSGLTSRVRFLGALPYEQVPDVLAACNAFATASVSEVYPLVVVEAAAAGLPVIGVDSPGVGEIVSDGVSGLLTAENAADISAAMVRLPGDASLQSTLQRGAREVADRHEIRASALRLASVYTQLAEKTSIPT